MTFIKRRIDVTISLGEGKFGDTKGPDVTLTGYRVSAAVVAYTADVQSQLQLRIFGLSQDMMNKLTSIGPVMTERRGRNRILVEAGDERNTLSTLYEGDIDQAWADYNQAPEVVFNVVALSSAGKALKPVPPRSYRGATSVAVVMRDIAASMELAFQNNGVDVFLSNPYFPGTDVDQLRACARAARISYTIERGILAIWPADGKRVDPPIEVSPELNLVGYPTFTGGGIACNLLYTPDVGMGRAVQVTSSIEAAHGEWAIVGVVHQLESEVPGGAWMSQILCRRIING
ncbi:baseplate hub protein [Achromobacter aegrifaciens]